MIRRTLIVFVAVALLFLTFVAVNATAQTSPAADVVLVLPFENTSDHPEYNWIGESFADSLSSLLNKPGLIVVNSDERTVAYQRLRLPLTVLPSRATAIKIAREVKASMIVIGTYNILPSPDDKTKAPAEKVLATITGEARVIRVNEGRMAGEVFDGSWTPRVYDFGGVLTTLQSMQGDIAYQILYQRDKALSISKRELEEAAKTAPSLAFEALTKALLIDERDPARAVYLKNALRLYAKDKGGAVYPDAAFQLGRFYLNELHPQWKEAAEYFTMLQKKDPHYGEAQFYAGLAYWKLGDLQNALSALLPIADEKVMPLVGVYNNAGAVSVEAARSEKKPEDRTRLLLQGITLLSRAADSSPDDATVLFNYAYALFLSEKYAEAAEKLERVVAANQRDGEAYFLLAKAQDRAHRAEAATATDNLARKNLQSYAKWETDWQKSQSIPHLKLRSRDVLNQVDISDLGRRRDQDEAKSNTAQEALNKIHELYQQGRDDEALAEIRKLLIIEPTNAEAYLMSGKINQRRGDQESAIAALKTAIFWDTPPPPRMIEAHILLGRIFLERGDIGEARKYATSAMSIDPNNQEALALQRQVTMGRP